MIEQFVRKLQCPNSAIELAALLDLAASELNLNDWGLLQLYGENSKSQQYTVFMESSLGKLGNNFDSEVVKFYNELPYSHFNNCGILRFFTSMRRDGTEDSYPITENGTELSNFQIAAIRISNLIGSDYLLYFNNKDGEISELLKDVLVLCALNANNSIPTIINSKENHNIKIGRRERQVLAWSSNGKTSYEIAKILDLSEHTINNYFF